jgi:hypothetical protein
MQKANPAHHRYEWNLPVEDRPGLTVLDKYILFLYPTRGSKLVTDRSCLAYGSRLRREEDKACGVER